MTTKQEHEDIRRLVQVAAAVCEDKKGVDTRILELDPIDSGLADFFLLTSATNDRQATAIADEIEFRLKKEFGEYAHSVEGRRAGEWILLDYVDFVVHVFLAERRAFYDIERLRKSAKPFTPEEFDAALKDELTQKTAAIRKKTVAKPAPAKKAAKKAVPAIKKVAPAKKAAVKKAAPVKAAAKKAVAATKKSVPAKKIVAKKAVPAKKVAAKKIVTKKAVPVKKALTKKAAPVKKVVAKKTVTKKAVKKAVPVKKASPVKKAAAKKIVKKAVPAKKVVLAKKAVKKPAKKTPARAKK
jgi:ribosome-associated protein